MYLAQGRRQTDSPATGTLQNLDELLHRLLQNMRWGHVDLRDIDDQLVARGSNWVLPTFVTQICSIRDDHQLRILRRRLRPITHDNRDLERQ